ncbi:MAG: polysaccharide biosynthesis protein [Planctomycetaceae bacterium]|nr:polysaccharide biosynthesis protein [Planctomycetaceae bacterium]
MDIARKKKLRWIVRQSITVLAYAIMSIAAFWLAFAFRYDFDFHRPEFQLFYQSIWWVLILKLGIFYLHGHFHGYGFYATFRDFFVLAKSCFIASAAIFILFSFTDVKLSRTVSVLDCVFTVFIIGMVRFGWRFFRQEVLPHFRKTIQRRTLIIGAGQQGVLLAGELEMHSEYAVAGFVSIHEWEKGRLIGQIPVLEHIDNLENVLHSRKIKEVLILSGVIAGDKLRKVISTCQKLDIRLRIVPPMESRLGGQTVPIREIVIEDLLKRDPVVLDDSSIGKLLSQKTVLVTGAGGSIGSEICRQIIRFNPETLLILGRGENRIFYLEKELHKLGFQGKLAPVIANVTNETRMEQVFAMYQPEVIFHAAAHKHVPLMEANIAEAVDNNIKGTKVVADLAEKYHASHFVLVSTDKAVNPTSVMGATKHLAERYVHSFSRRSKTKFVVTRFGNVLGSAGSVVPVFRQQIKAGGPITVTDFRMTRYFMTIPEASQLVLQAAAIGDGGEIFVLDMGEPVRIVDLAKDLIRLSGLPENAIEIHEIGMRPGEKLYEELYFASETAICTSHPKLRCATHRRFDKNVVNQQISEILEMLNSANDNTSIQIQNKLHELIEEYQDDSEPQPQSTEPLTIKLYKSGAA